MRKPASSMNPIFASHIATLLCPDHKVYRGADLWSVMRDMHSQHLASLATKWQQYQAVGQKLHEDHHQSLEILADMKSRYIAYILHVRAHCCTRHRNSCIYSMSNKLSRSCRWNSTLASLTEEAEAEMQHLEADIFKARKQRSRRQDPASMGKLLSALMH